MDLARFIQYNDHTVFQDFINLEYQYSRILIFLNYIIDTPGVVESIRDKAHSLLHLIRVNDTLDSEYKYYYNNLYFLSALPEFRLHGQEIPSFTDYPCVTTSNIAFIKEMIKANRIPKIYPIRMDSFESLDIIRCQHTNNELSYE